MTVYEMTIDELRAFIASVPWRAVNVTKKYAVEGRTETEDGAAAQPHEYVIRNWSEVDDAGFARFAATIAQRGYQARYSPPYAPERVMICTYLVVGQHYYWTIASQRSLNRALVAHRQHTPLEEPDPAPEQLRLID